MISESQDTKQEGAETPYTTTPNNVILDYELLKRATLTLRAIRHPERKAILQAIHQAGNITVNELCKKVNLKQSVTSLHLTILRATKIVDTRRDGRNIFYSINRQRIEDVMEAARHLAGDGTREIVSINSPPPTS